jgi:hypothetical protein
MNSPKNLNIPSPVFRSFSRSAAMSSQSLFVLKQTQALITYETFLWSANGIARSYLASSFHHLDSLCINITSRQPNDFERTDLRLHFRSQLWQVTSQGSYRVAAHPAILITNFTTKFLLLSAILCLFRLSSLFSFDLKDVRGRRIRDGGRF